MTQANDPWAAAGVATQAPAREVATVGQGQGMAGAFPPPSAESRLFTPQSVAPSMFNKTHALGTERTGIVKVAPVDRQEQDFTEKRPKYFSRSKVAGKATTLDAIDGPTGQPNDPIMGTHIELATDYRMTAAEIVAVGGGRDPSFAQQDDGTRVLVVSGKQPYKAFFDAIADANSRGLNLRSGADLVGKRVTARRVGQTPNQTGNPSWVVAYRIDAA